MLTIEAKGLYIPRLNYKVIYLFISAFIDKEFPCVKEVHTLIFGGIAFSLLNFNQKGFSQYFGKMFVHCLKCLRRSDFPVHPTGVL